MELHADSLQGVLFVAPGQQQGDALKVWEKLYPGDSPDAFQKGNAAPGVPSTASGDRGGVTVTVTSQVGRIDIGVAAVQGSGDPTAGPRRLQNVAAAAQAVAALLNSASVGLQFVRVALVMDLGKTIQAGKETEEIKRLLPDFPFPEHSTDISVQFNTRRKSVKFEQVQLNRLCLWQTGQVGFLQLQQAPVLRNHHVRLPMIPYVGLRSDVNTAPETFIPSTKMAELIEEVTEESLAIYREGAKRLGQ